MRTISILSTALALASGLAAQKVLEIEPNDTVGQAQTISPGQHIVASYSSLADLDWFAFSLSAPGQVHLHTVATITATGVTVSRDNRIAIYDATGTTRLAWNDGATGTMADCGVTLPAGSYTAVVGIKSGAVPANYDLDFFVLPPVPVTGVEAAEPNGASSPVPSTFTPGQVVEGDLSLGDDDFWSFTLTGRGIMQAATYDDGGVPQLDNLSLQYHTGGPGAWALLGTAASNSASHRVTNFNHPGMLSAGTYAFSVVGGSAAVGTPPWDNVKTGRYSLRTCLIDMPGTTIITETNEPLNDNVTTPAGIFALGDDLSGFTTGSTGAGIDWFGFGVTGPTTVGFMAEGDPTNGTPLAGSSLRLWDSTGTISLASSSGGGATTHGRLIFTIERAGFYFVQIAGPTTTVSGDYILHTGGCVPLYVSASTRQEPPSTNACIGSNALRPAFGNLSGEVPAFNSTFVTRLTNALPSTFAIYALGFSSIPPLTLGFGGPDSLGNPTPCALRVAPDVLMLGITDATGFAELILTFPYVGTDIGLKIFQQALCFDPTLNGFGFSVSNDASYVLGDRAF